MCTEDISNSPQLKSFLFNNSALNISQVWLLWPLLICIKLQRPLLHLQNFLWWKHLWFSCYRHGTKHNLCRMYEWPCDCSIIWGTIIQDGLAIWSWCTNFWLPRLRSSKWKRYFNKHLTFISWNISRHTIILYFTVNKSLVCNTLASIRTTLHWML